VPPFEVTTAVNAPAIWGCVVKVTVNLIGVAPVTLPITSRLKFTVLLPGVVSNPEPLIIIMGALTVRLLVLEVTVGAATILATCTALLLLPPFVLTIAVRLPVAVGCVVKATVN